MKTTLMALVGTAAICLSASSAQAKQGFAVGLDVGPNFVTEDLGPGADSAGIGFNGRLGYQFEGGIIRLTPEAKVGFESPGTPDALRVMGGIRLSFLKGLQPVAFAHLGGLIGDLEGFAWDVGGGLDFAAGPFMIGANVSYNRVEEQEFSFVNLTDGAGAGAYEWIQVAASVGFVF